MKQKKIYYSPRLNTFEFTARHVLMLSTLTGETDGFLREPGYYNEWEQGAEGYREQQGEW